MDLLLTNDDGIDAHGLHTLEATFAALGTTWAVAPRFEQSGKGHGFSLHAPVRVESHGERRWSVTGTPADCAYLALHHVLPVRPDVVVSGINHGSNLGNDVLYSGTVAAAVEACMQGYPAVAVSLHKMGDRPYTHFETAARVALRVVQGVIANGLPDRVCLNINVPDVPHDALRGIRACAQGWRHYEPGVDARTDPRGRAYYWLGGAHAGFEPMDGTDGPLADQGFATVTPLQVDLTRHDFIDTLAGWVNGE